MALTISHRPPPAAKPLDASLRGYLTTNADIVTRITKPVHMDDIGALSAQSDTADRVREHRRETRLSALRHPGEEPPLAGARARGRRRTSYLKTLAYRLRQPPRGFKNVKTGPVKEVVKLGTTRPTGPSCRFPLPQGQGHRAVRDGDEHHPRSGDRLLQFLPRRHPCGRTAPRAHQLRHAAFAHHHAQVSRDGP